MAPGLPIPASDAGHRIRELDSVRGLAACAVLFCHLPRGFWFGETGVDLFFVLSGYLITSIILRNCDQPSFLRVFYFRRSLRIFPIYYLALFVVLALNAVRKHPGATDGIWYYFAYLQNIQAYWGGTAPPVGVSVGHTWTLAIEEQFYLLWPAIILFLGTRRVLWIALTLVVLPPVLRSCGLDRVTLLGHTDGLALGAILAVYGLRSKQAFAASNAPRYLTAAMAAFAGYFAIWFYFSGHGMTGKQMVQHPIAISLISCAYTGVIGFTISISGSNWARVLRFAPLVWIGTISYGLYLYHWIIYEWLDIVIKFGRRYGDIWWLDVLKVVVSFVVAAMSWYAIERPLMKLKNVISYDSKTNIPPASNGSLPAHLTCSASQKM